MPVLDENGREILDQTPVSLPLHYDRPEPLHMRIRRMILEATAAHSGDIFAAGRGNPHRSQTTSASG